MQPTKIEEKRWCETGCMASVETFQNGNSHESVNVS